MTRIVSLLPSATEIVSALGFSNSIVGRSHECDFPAGLDRVPIVSAPKFPVDDACSDIDSRVRTLVSEGLSIYRVDAELFRKLKPDLVITQTQCAVCAVTPRDLDEALRDWTGARPVILPLEPNGLDDVWRDMRRIGEALSAGPRGEDLVATLRARLSAIAETARTLERPTVATIEWLDPLMSGGNWMPDLVGIAGGMNLFGTAGAHSPCLAWNDVVAADPDAIVVLPCGFEIPQTIADLATLTIRHGWNDLRAVRSGKVFLLDGHHYFNRPGPRLVESAEMLAEILHPDVFHFGHRGKGWIVLTDL